MTINDVPRIVEIERLAYTTPWPPSAYRREIQENRMARYIVVRDTWIQLPAAPVQPEESRRPFPLSLLLSRQTSPVPPETLNIVAFAGLWHQINEAHITTIATHPDYRGHGVGELMLASLIGVAYAAQARYVTLEVRVTNSVAQSLYRKYGFTQIDIRRRYYSDNHEDAYIMSTQDITSDDYRARYADLRARLTLRLETESASVTSEASDGS
jgi:ribosomal-protein-alanine N-acetyltransferase